MKLLSLHLTNFKSFTDVDLLIESESTTLVGENGSGKSSVGEALSLLASQQDIAPNLIRQRSIESSVDASFLLTQEELDELLIGPLVSSLPNIEVAKADEVRTWLISQGDLVTLKRRSGNPAQSLHWGDLYFYRGFLHVGEILQPESDRTLISVLSTTEHWIEFLTNAPRTIRYNVADIVGSFAQEFRKKLIVIPDFRQRNTHGTRSGDLEALNGTQLASTLLNLRAHSDDAQQKRYTQIVGVFHQLFPQFEIQAIEIESGTGHPDVRFTSADTGRQLSLNQVSAGLQESLALVTNLVAREGLIYFIEHPETHLQPHAIRAFSDLLNLSAATNQIITVTHSPYLVNPERPLNLRRLQLMGDSGTTVHSISHLSVDPQSHDGAKLAGQISTALRLIEAREAVFSRAVLLVEDQSQYEFIKQLANKIIPGLDSIGVTVVFTAGQDGFKTYLPVLNGLGIPFIALRDLPWGDDSVYPPDQYLSLGSELEEYLDQEGFEVRRREISIEFGSGSKVRIARILGSEIKAEDIPLRFTEIFQRISSLVGVNGVSAD